MPDRSSSGPNPDSTTATQTKRPVEAFKLPRVPDTGLPWFADEVAAIDARFRASLRDKENQGAQRKESATEERNKNGL